MDISVMESQPIGDYFDEEMTFLKQIGVGYVECHGGLQVDTQLQSIEMGDPLNTAKTIHKIKESGLHVRVLAFNFVHSLMGRPKGAKEIARGCEVIKLMGEEDIPIMRIFPQGIRLGPSGVPGRHSKAHRGGSARALLFCVGTRYESGRDVYDQIRLFGRKICHVHLRNVRGTLLHSGGYDEVAIDEGDMDMFKVLKTLKDVGYDGCISPDHPSILINDEKRRAGLAFMVGYIRALIQAL